MQLLYVNDRMDTKTHTFPYRGKQLEVKDVWIRWLSQAGPDGAPEYGLRFFTIGPSGYIPIHNQFLSPDHVHSERPIELRVS